MNNYLNHCRMKNLIIKPAGIDDVDVLRTIGIRTFSEAFADKNTEDDMAAYFKKAFTSQRIEAELRGPEVQFHLAVTNQHIIGYMKINAGDAQSEALGAKHMEIERIYVVAEAQKHGIGQILLDEALCIARNDGARILWLGVWEHNPGAIRFYERNGFVAFGRQDFMLGNDRETDVLMRRRIE
jgi:ribosomal protein S18 acetylase RimI-like enzyme